MNRSYKWIFISSIIISVMSLVMATTVFFIKPNNQSTNPPTTQQQPAGGEETPTEPEEKLYEMSADGKYLYFGEYPQSLKADTVSIVTTTPDRQGYFMGDDGERYYLWNRDYFKVEPLKWRILTQEDGEAFVVCDVVVDNVMYVDERYYDLSSGELYLQDILDDGENVYPNDWEYSNLRNYMNEDFYLRAFNGEERKIISQTLVKNGVEQHSEGSYNFSDDTLDYIFALSYTELINEDYGFVANPEAYDDNRIWMVSDFAVANGAGRTTEDEMGLNWLEPGSEAYQQAMSCVGSSSGVGLRTGKDGYYTDRVCYSGVFSVIGESAADHWVDVAPAMWIEL